MTLTTVAQRTIAQQQVLARPAPEPPPPHVARRFSVWMGSSIAPHFKTVEQIAIAVYALLPPGVWDEVEVLLKAGEGGSWQSQFDSHPLAISGTVSLALLVADGKAHGLRISPYVVVRARPQWIVGEQTVIRHCVNAAGRCVLNVEPGTPYYNGPNDPAFIKSFYDGIGVPKETLEACLIPRAGQVAELGGAKCVYAWTSNAGSASWECYGIVAGISGPTSLLVDEAIPRIDTFGWAPPGLQYRIPLVQRPEIGRWAPTIWAAAGLQAWHLTGDI